MMPKDQINICTRCSSDACYIQEVNNVTLKSCYGCGFQTTSEWVRDSELVNHMLETFPNLYKELAGEDENGHIWFPTTVNLPDKGMVFVDGSSESPSWAAVKAIPMSETEKIKFEKKGKTYKFKMDMVNIKYYPFEKGFMDALEYIGLFEEDKHEN
jgi:hypothetical protein